MADQQAPVEGTPEHVDTPGQGTDAPQIPAGYVPEDRYKEAQAWGTREAQWRSEHESTVSLVQAAEQGDVEAQQALASRLGWQLGQDDDDGEEFADTQQQLDPTIAAKLAKIDEIDQWRESMTTEQQQAQHYSGYRSEVDPELTKLGVPEAFVESVADIAYNQLPAIQTPQGPVPDLEGAVNQFKELQALVAAIPEVQQQAVEAWRKGKKAPHMSPTGREGTEVPDLSTPEGKVAYVMSKLHEEQ